MLTLYLALPSNNGLLSALIHDILGFGYPCDLQSSEKFSPIATSTSFVDDSKIIGSPLIDEKYGDD